MTTTAPGLLDTVLVIADGVSHKVTLRNLDVRLPEIARQAGIPMRDLVIRELPPVEHDLIKLNMEIARMTMTSLDTSPKNRAERRKMKRKGVTP